MAWLSAYLPIEQAIVNAGAGRPHLEDELARLERMLPALTRPSGLRRGEVASLAGVSVEYYSKLERGAIGGVSASVLACAAAR